MSQAHRLDGCSRCTTLECAPVANVYRLVLEELRAANGGDATPTVVPDAPAEERYLMTGLGSTPVKIVDR